MGTGYQPVEGLGSLGQLSKKTAQASGPPELVGSQARFRVNPFYRRQPHTPVPGLGPLSPGSAPVAELTVRHQVFEVS